MCDGFWVSKFSCNAACVYFFSDEWKLTGFSEGWTDDWILTFSDTKDAILHLIQLYCPSVNLVGRFNLKVWTGNRIIRSSFRAADKSLLIFVGFHNLLETLWHQSGEGEDWVCLRCAVGLWMDPWRPHLQQFLSEQFEEVFPPETGMWAMVSSSGASQPAPWAWGTGLAGVSSEPEQPEGLFWTTWSKPSLQRDEYI